MNLATVKLSKVKRLPNRTKLNTSSSRRTGLDKGSGTVRRDKIELDRPSSVRFENLLKFDSFTVYKY